MEPSQKQKPQKAQKIVITQKKAQKKPAINFSYQNKNVNEMPIQFQQTKNVSYPIQQQKINSYNVPYQIQSYQNEDIQMQYQEQQLGGYGFGGNKSGLNLLRDLDKQKKIAAIIISFCGGGSYDELFTSVQQQSMEGTQVLVYSCGNLYLPALIKAFKGDPQDNQSKQLVNQLKQIDPDCVVFNWECCGTYTGRNFPQGKDNLFQFLKMIVDRGHMAMFSDFSLKALINEWGDSNILGPNPFKQIDQTSNQFQIRFLNGQLKECPSVQLQIVGDMAEKGFCQIQAMGGTIVYSVDHKKAQKAKQYKLQVLTVVTNAKITEQNLICKKGQYKGAAGHVLLTFPKGGHILTSMGHWVQLMKIDTSQKKLFEIARRQYGQQYACQMEQQYQSMDKVSQQAYVSKKAVNFVQNRAPCSDMYTKSMKKKG